MQQEGTNAVAMVSDITEEDRRGKVMSELFHNKLRWEKLRKSLTNLKGSNQATAKSIPLLRTLPGTYP